MRFASPALRVGGWVMERLDLFMGRANAAYYGSHDPFRDFTTAPEVSQVFGELLGAWAAVVWEAMGRPDPVVLAELGPGRGTLMQDGLRAAGRVAPAFRGAARVHFVESSVRLRAEQAVRVPEATWHEGVAGLPGGPAIVLANEFFDALPVRQFVRGAAGWLERFVEEGRVVEVPVGADAPVLPECEVGAVREVNEASRAVVGALAARVVAAGGAVLMLDYGPMESGAGDSLQALHGGRMADPFEAPGSRDLTAHVDFADLARVARGSGAEVHGPVQQGPFLARLGLFQRTGVLARGLAPDAAAGLVQAAQRLAEPDRMGGLFKAMAIVQPGVSVPPGFE